MIDGGYILQPRSFDKSEASHLPPATRELWFYILRNVNHSKRLGLERGQGFFSLDHIQEALCWYTGFRKNTYSKPQLTKALRRLRERNMVATTKATRGITVTVCNYDEYQDPKSYEGKNEETTKETRKNLGGRTINKKVEECKKQEQPLEPSSGNSNELPAPWRDQYDPDLVLFVEGFAAYAKQQHGAMAPTVTDSLLKSGAATIEKLVRIDGHNFQTIVEAMRWAVDDDFWAPNVLSLAGLRKKKDGVMKIQKIIGGMSHGIKKSITSADVLDEAIRRLENGEESPCLHPEESEDGFFASPPLLTEARRDSSDSRALVPDIDEETRGPVGTWRR